VGAVLSEYSRLHRSLPRPHTKLLTAPKKVALIAETYAAATSPLHVTVSAQEIYAALRSGPRCGLLRFARNDEEGDSDFQRSIDSRIKKAGHLAPLF
jgi:hypothetical protein